MKTHRLTVARTMDVPKEKGTNTCHNANDEVLHFVHPKHRYVAYNVCS